MLVKKKHGQKILDTVIPGISDMTYMYFFCLLHENIHIVKYQLHFHNWIQKREHKHFNTDLSLTLTQHHKYRSTNNYQYKYSKTRL